MVIIVTSLPSLRGHQTHETGAGRPSAAPDQLMSAPCLVVIYSSPPSRVLATRAQMFPGPLGGATLAT
eukprot:9480614-Pyramimonas_sp.AAC.2